MDYLMSGGQTLVGIALLVLWRVTLFFFSRRNKNKPLSSMGFVLWPCLFLIWLVGGCILILHGVGMA